MKNLKTIAFALLVVFGTTTAMAQNKKVNVGFFRAINTPHGAHKNEHKE